MYKTLKNLQWKKSILFQSSMSKGNIDDNHARHISKDTGLDKIRFLELENTYCYRENTKIKVKC